MAPNYSIIIPHKDIPDLLLRCLESIPQRDDVEVIVVDDNSDSQKVDFAHFPQWKGKHYQYVLAKEGKGAGYARNVGLNYAQGRWIVFADADDFFMEDFNGLLDEMVDAEEDVVFFDYINVLSDDITQQVEDRVWYRTYIVAYLNGDKSETGLRTGFVTPTCKFVKRELIEKHRVCFNEVKWSNDLYFACRIGHLAKSIKVSGRIGYAVTTRKGSVTDDFCATPKEFRVRLIEAQKCDALFCQYGLADSNMQTFGQMMAAYRKQGFRKCVGLCLGNAFHPCVFWTMAYFLAKRVVKNDCRKTRKPSVH